MTARLQLEDCAEALGVSRETLLPCGRLLDLLTRWQTAYNLVGRKTLDDPWRRHILDSAQLVRFLPAPPASVVDLGSGAGFPGLVLALLSDLEVHLVESDGTKVQFLREAIRQTCARAVVHQARIEAVGGLSADVVTARALAPLPRLLELAEPFLAAGARCLFLKSSNVASELTAAAAGWHMEAETFESLSDPRGLVLQLRNVRRAPHRQP